MAKVEEEIEKINKYQAEKDENRRAKELVMIDRPLCKDCQRLDCKEGLLFCRKYNVYRDIDSRQITLYSTPEETKLCDFTPKIKGKDGTE